MKTLFSLLCSLSIASAAFGQAPVPAPDAGQTGTPPFTSQELDQLLGPIALYPDPLIGLILPASTVPSDIVMADRYVAAAGDPSQIPNEPWDDSVKGLTHYPDLLKWLDDNLSWTTQLGTAYLAQPQDVMNSIQQLRARAKADGTLVSNAQQAVDVDDAGNITITPTDADTIYVPQYDTDAVYDDDYDLLDGPVIAYGDGYPCGPWLYYWPDWRRHRIFLGDFRRWRDFRGGAGFAADPGSRPWNPNMNRVRLSFQASANTARPTVVRPQPMAGAKIIEPKHLRTATTTPGVVSAPQTDFTGRGTGTVTTARPAVTRPGVIPPPVVVRSPQQAVIDEYGRGSDARAASERGQESRAVIINRPVETVPVRQAAPAAAQSFGGGGGGERGSGGGGGGGSGQPVRGR